MRGVVLLSIIAAVTAQTCSVENSAKRDCGFAGINSDSCLAKGCCWSPAEANSATPWCFYKGTNSNSGYALTTVKPTSTGYSGTLSKLASESTPFGEDIKELKLDVYFQANDVLRVKITDSAKTRWEIPQSLISREETPSIEFDAADLNYSFEFTSSPFSFEVKRKSDGVSIFKSANSLVFKDQYIELATAVSPSATTFGLGESARLHHALQAGHTYTLWAGDVAALGKDINLYSSFPFYLQVEAGSAHGALLLNR